MLLASRLTFKYFVPLKIMVEVIISNYLFIPIDTENKSVLLYYSTQPIAEGRGGKVALAGRALPARQGSGIS